MRRRRFLTGLGMGAAVAAGTLAAARGARGAWGSWPGHAAPGILPVDRRAHGILELFLFGGMSAWDTFYCVPRHGEGEGRFFHALDPGPGAEACGLAGDLTRPFAVDATGNEVHLGPWTHPLWARPDLLARMRVVVNRHEQLPHETALPLALCGHALGNPRMAGTAAAVQRYFQDRETRVLPHAAVIHPGSRFPGLNLQAATAVGLHPAAARGLDLPTDAIGALLGRLDRPATSGRHGLHDAVVSHYTKAYEGRLVAATDGAPVTAPGFRDFQAADRARQSASTLAELVPPEALGLRGVTQCGVSAISQPHTSATLARTMLTRPEDPLRYALWIDAGLRATVDGGHDTHEHHVAQASVNYAHALQELADAIALPGDDDPTKIDLDRTLVVVHSEFGRAPVPQDERGGLNHWPHAGVTVLMGGPVAPEAQGVYGVVDEATGYALDYATPAEIRIAMLLALGVYPFGSDAFAVADVRGASTELGAVRRVTGEILGVPN